MKKIKKSCSTCLHSRVGNFNFVCVLKIKTKNNGAFCIEWDKRLPNEKNQKTILSIIDSKNNVEIFNCKTNKWNKL